MKIQRYEARDHRLEVHDFSVESEYEQTRPVALFTVLVLRSGEKYEGKVNIDMCTENSVHLSLAPGGWLTCRMDEIAAIEAKPSAAKPRL